MSKQALHFSSRYADDVFDPAPDYVFDPTTPVIVRKQEVVNGQILDVDGEIHSFDPRLSSYQFSDFTVSSLNSVGYVPDGVRTISPHPFTILDDIK